MIKGLIYIITTNLIYRRPAASPKSHFTSQGPFEMPPAPSIIATAFADLGHNIISLILHFDMRALLDYALPIYHNTHHHVICAHYPRFSKIHINTAAPLPCIIHFIT